MTEKIDFRGLEAARILNDKGDEVILLYGAGPRIISFKPEGSKNFFYINDDDFKRVDSSEGWKIYGGTRLWTSVESKWSYLPDNDKCDIEIGENYIEVVSKTNPETLLQKSLKVEAINNAFKVTYSIKNDGDYLITAGLWALSCLKPGSASEIYLPWGEDSPWNVKDMKYWRAWISSCSDIKSKQWNPTNEFFIIKPTGEVGKVGFTNRWGYAIFKNEKINFVKLSDYIEGAFYPDDGCSFEIYTCKDFYELESLSPIFAMKPKRTYYHTEVWWAGTKDIPTNTIKESYSEIKKLFL